MKILILGGTGEARALADRLVDAGHDVTTSLAGRTSAPLLPQGALRIGGFGGPEGLAACLRTEAFDWLVDATHPYAGRISANAVAASAASGIPLLRLMRAPWDEPEDARWRHFESPEAAARALPPGARVLLTTGHAGLDHFLARADCGFLVRVIQAPQAALPDHAQLLLERPPYDLDHELALLRDNGVTHLVSKNSGGGQTAAKLAAAGALGVAVIIIDRPAYPAAREVASVDEALAILHSDASRR